MSKYYQVDDGGMGALGQYTEKWDDVLPKGTTFYWRMQPPKTSVKKISPVPGKKLTGMQTANQITPPPRLEPIKDPYDGTAVDRSIGDAPAFPSTHVNVRDEHHWTESPMSSRGEVPTLNLKEYEVKQNSGINQILQQIGVAVGAMDSAAGSLKAIMEMFKGEKGLEKAAQKIKQEIEEFTQTGDLRTPEVEMMSADPMQVYESLYTREPTGFKYALPYMENQQFKTGGGFTEEAQMGGFMDMVNDIAEFGGKFASALAGRFVEPGRYIEKPKNYQFSGREKSVTVTFPLFNTKNYSEIVKNWQFLFLLTYQNTPARISKDIIRPAAQYEAYIPGSWYCKYCSITDMTVNFHGARREMDIPVPFLDQASEDGGQWLLQKRMIKTIIPDAYDVSITLTEIFGESQNSLYHMLAQSTDFQVSTGERQDNDLQFGGEMQIDNQNNNINAFNPIA